MKYFYTIILGLLLRVSAIGQETPAITMTTTKAMGSTISIGLEAIASTTIRLDFGDGNKMAYIIENKISTISGTVGASQVIKIYGTGINYLLCQDNNLTLLDVTKCPDLIELYCFNNQLTNIDLTNNQNLIDLQCYRNRLNVLDVSYCPKLTWLECHSNSLTSLKLNTNLLFLNCELNMLNTLDINNSTRIAELICYGNQLTSLNLENVTSLKKLDCSRNQLTSLNVSNQIQLVELQCWENKLGSLNVSNNAKLSTLDCSSNKLSLSSLPLKQGNWSLYKYNLQSPLTIPTTIYIEGMLNLSGQYSINGNNTTYTWKASNGYVLIENTDYKNDKGRITFIKAQGGMTCIAK